MFDLCRSRIQIMRFNRFPFFLWILLTRCQKIFKYFNAVPDNFSADGFVRYVRFFGTFCTKKCLWSWHLIIEIIYANSTELRANCGLSGPGLTTQVKCPRMSKALYCLLGKQCYGFFGFVSAKLVFNRNYTRETSIFSMNVFFLFKICSIVTKSVSESEILGFWIRVMQKFTDPSITPWISHLLVTWVTCVEILGSPSLDHYEDSL
jgi:hypothetical protein